MIIARVRRLKKLQVSFHSEVHRFLFIASIFFWSVVGFSQTKDQKMEPNSIAVYAGIGNEHTFLFDDTDYSFKSRYIKASFQYDLNQKKYQLSLAIQPQIHFLKHQLLNPRSYDFY